MRIAEGRNIIAYATTIIKMLSGSISVPSLIISEILPGKMVIYNTKITAICDNWSIKNAETLFPRNCILHQSIMKCVTKMTIAIYHKDQSPTIRYAIREWIILCKVSILMLLLPPFSFPSTIHFVWRKKSAMICAKSNRNSIDILSSCFRCYYCSEPVY